jgi:hypothetical protein
MSAIDKATTNITSVEELSVYSLDRSIEGISYMEEDAASCCTAIEQNSLHNAYRQLITLTSQLHSFDTFEKELSSLFQIDTGIITDSAGNLQGVESSFRSALSKLGDMIENSRYADIPCMLKKELLPALRRFRELIPLIRDHIQTEYMHA